MAQILLISDTERVKRVFAALENEDALRMRTAATLVQADQEVAASVPDITFVQSRISGFSGDIILRHLRKVLPEDAVIVLLAADAADLEQALRLGELHLDLTNEDEALSRLILQFVTGEAGHKDATAVPSAQKPQSAPRTERKPKPPNEPVLPDRTAAAPGGKEAAAAVSQPMPDGPPQPVPPEAFGAPPAGPKPVEPMPNPPQASPPGGKDAPSFAADLAAAAGAPDYALADGGRAGHQGQEVYPAPGTMLAEALAHGEPLADLLLREERKKRRKFWFIALLIAFIAIPVASYLAGRRAAPPEPALAPGTTRQAKHAPGKAPAPTGATQAAAPKAAAPSGAGVPPTPAVSPAPAVPPTPAVSPKPGSPARPGAPPGSTTPAVSAAKAAGPAPGAVPPAHGVSGQGAPAQVTPAQRTPAPKPATPAAPAAKAPAAPQAPAVPAAKPAPSVQAAPAPKAGARSLPAVVAQAKVDPAYGKAHPGWQRYLGNSVEFRVLQEAGQYRTLQVGSRTGQPIPDQFFAKLLLEFGGVTRYQLASSSEKGQYLVEQGSTSGGMSVTTYRDRNDRKIREFQLSYR